jgi:hypothetical protein
LPVSTRFVSKRPFPPQKAYAVNGRSRHKKSMQQTAVPPAHTTPAKRPFPPRKVYAENGRSHHNSQFQGIIRTAVSDCRFSTPLATKTTVFTTSSLQNIVRLLHSGL